ncbi:hypothetical protein DFH09DRAFT_1327401 [Mycena vulgaris]|nr:hypothetical protein DFH09DRAFT_1327401 [Mycena vulgaris]
MSGPIRPMSGETHPSSWIPPKPSTWKDCYLSTFWSCPVRSPTLLTEVPIDYKFDLKEMGKHDRFLGRDLARNKALCAAAQIAPSTGPFWTPITLKKSPQMRCPSVSTSSLQEPTANAVPPLEYDTIHDWHPTNPGSPSRIPPALELTESRMGIQSPSSVSLQTTGDVDDSDGVKSTAEVLDEGLFSSKASRPMITVKLQQRFVDGQGT